MNEKHFFWLVTRLKILNTINHTRKIKVIKLIFHSVWHRGIFHVNMASSEEGGSAYPYNIYSFQLI